MTRCPCPDNSNSNIELCSALDKYGLKHENALVGNSEILHGIRQKVIKEIVINYKYQLLSHIKPNYVSSIRNTIKFGKDIFTLNGDIWQNAFFTS